MIFPGAPLSLVGPALAVGAAALVSLYLLKLRRRRLEVPFADLWRRVLSETQSTALWKRLRRIASLVVQLILLALILTALLDPRLSATQHGRSVAIVVDCSASMQSTDGGGGATRLNAAKEEARRLVRGLAGDDEAIVVAMDARPAPRGGFTRDDRALVADIDALAATDTSADVPRALGLAGDALRGRQRPTLVLIGDGAWRSVRSSTTACARSARLSTCATCPWARRATTSASPPSPCAAIGPTRPPTRCSSRCRASARNRRR